MRPNIRKQSVAAALTGRSAPRMVPRYKGVAYSTTQESNGVWRWQVLPANAQLHVHECTIATGFSLSREAAEIAAQTAIDMQLGS